jgi:hypothetical protein
MCPLPGCRAALEGASYGAQDDEIEVIDVSTGQSLGKVDPPGIDSIGRLGKITRTLGEIRTESSAPAEAGFANSFA